MAVLVRCVLAGFVFLAAIFAGPTDAYAAKKKRAASAAPPRDVCPECGKEAKNLFQFSGRGEVYSYTTIYEPPTGYEENATYTMALINLEGRPLLITQLTDLGGEPVEIEAPKEKVTRRFAIQQPLPAKHNNPSPLLESSEKPATDQVRWCYSRQNHNLCAALH